MGLGAGAAETIGLISFFLFASPGRVFALYTQSGRYTVD